MDERQQIISSCCSTTEFHGKLKKPFGLFGTALRLYLFLFLKYSSLFNNCVSLFVDIAIGAPFAGKDQRGKVLIYNGNKNGLNAKASQILQGVWASQAVPSGFGFTLRGDSDIDKNDYPGKSFFLFLQQSLLPRKSYSLDDASCLSSSLVQVKAKLAHHTGSLGTIPKQLS